jgi:DNA-binding HxlR family transcriptional regulator
MALREGLSGWHISGVTALQTGFPVTIADKALPNSLYCNAGQYLSYTTARIRPMPQASTSRPSIRATSNHQWFDPTLFSQEPLGSFGNVKRNFFHGPGFNYTNLSLYKDFPLGAEKARYVEIRLEAFNAFNHANFGVPDGNYTDGTRVDCLLWRSRHNSNAANLLQGTLDMLILRTLLYGPAHGHQIGKHIQRTTNDFLQMQHGSLYPALHRLEQRGWVVSKWETAPGPQSGVQVLPADRERQKAAGGRRIAMEADGRSCGARDVARR